MRIMLVLALATALTSSFFLTRTIAVRVHAMSRPTDPHEIPRTADPREIPRTAQIYQAADMPRPFGISRPAGDEMPFARKIMIAIFMKSAAIPCSKQ